MASTPARFRRPNLAITLAITAASLTPRTGSAQTCPGTSALSSGVSVAATADPALYSITPGLARWSAVGVRAADAQNWNIEARDVTAPFPTCFSGVLANSSGAGIDFLVTDWRFRSTQTDYIGAGTTGQTGTSARVQYEQTFFDYQANMPFDLVSVGANDVLKVRESSLFAGVRYFIEIWPSAGLTGLKCHLFAPVTSGSGWVARSGQAMEQALTAGVGNTVEYTPSVAGYHAIVITNESGTSGSFYIAVRRCPSSASGLTDNLPRLTVSLDDWPGFTPPAPTWGVVGVRGEPGYSYNWDVAPGFRAQNGPYMSCSDSVIASQNSGLNVRLIAGDFRANPLRFYTAHAGLEGTPKTTSQGYMEWEDGQDSLVVNAPPTVVSPPAHNVLDAWSIRLIKGGTYTFQLTPAGGATASYQMLLFANPSPGTPYWATRPDGVSMGTLGAYTVSATGLYGLVVVNDNGGTGNYSLLVTSDLLAVGDGGPTALANRIRAVTPNPGSGAMRIDYELARGGTVVVRVSDVAGRVVETLPARADAGRHSMVWNGRGGPGVYFVTLTVDGRAQDRSVAIRLR
jgi:hypothetical protein